MLMVDGMLDLFQRTMRRIGFRICRLFQASDESEKILSANARKWDWWSEIIMIKMAWSGGMVW